MNVRRARLLFFGGLLAGALTVVVYFALTGQLRARWVLALLGIPVATGIAISVDKRLRAAGVRTLVRTLIVVPLLGILSLITVAGIDRFAS